MPSNWIPRALLQKCVYAKRSYAKFKQACFADRWNFTPFGSTFDYSTKCKIKKTDEGMRIETQELEGSANVILRQQLEDVTLKKILGKTITLSICVKHTNLNGIAFSFNTDDNTGFKNDFSIPNIKDTTDYVIFQQKFTIPKDAKVFVPQILFTVNQKGATVDFKYAKLEVGDKATPFTPRNYGEELALCQRYYQSLNLYKQKYYGVGILNSDGSNIGILRIPLSFPLRQYPTFILKGKLPVILSDGVTIDKIMPDKMGTVICKAGVALSKELPVGIYPIEGLNAEDDVCLDAEIY